MNTPEINRILLRMLRQQAIVRDRKRKRRRHHHHSGGGGGATLLQTLIAQDTPTILQMQFNGTTVITTDGWSIATDGPNALSISSVSDSGTSTPSFTLSREILPGEGITLSYIGGTTTVNGKDLGDITDEAVTNSVNYWHVPFTGTSVDATKGAITNPGSADFLVSQNDKLLFTRVNDNAATLGVNHWQSALKFTRGVFSCKLNAESGFATSIWRFQPLVVDASNFIAIQKTSVGSKLRLAVQVGGPPLEFDDDADGTGGLPDLSPSNLWVKAIYLENNIVVFKYYNGSAWVTIATTSAFNIGASGWMNFGSSSNVDDAPGNQFSFDEAYFTAEDYDTETPDLFFLNDFTMGDESILWGDLLRTFE